MPRRPRVHIEGGLYYVSSVGLADQPVFQEPQDYETYLELLQLYKEQYGFGLYAFALLPDSLHLCIEVPEATTISAIIHAINSRYTKYLNGRLARKGHVFKGRFQSIPIEKETYLSEIVRYVHTLPKRWRLETEVGDYPYSSYQLYTNGQSKVHPGKLPQMLEEIADGHRHVSFGGFSGEPFGGWAFSKDWDSEELIRIEQGLADGILGSEAFVKLVELKVERAAKGLDKPEPKKLPGIRVRRRWLLAATACAIALALFLRAEEMTQVYHYFESQVQNEVAAAVQEVNSSMKANEAQLKTEIRREFAKQLRTTHAAEGLSLNGTAWQVELVPARAFANAGPISDQLLFENGRVASGFLASQGFPQTNYSLTVEENGSVTWETMQTSGSGEIASWRGEWRGDRMRGVFSRQSATGGIEEYNFVARKPAHTAATRLNTSEI